MTPRDRAVALLREPLVHFLIAGGLVFALLSGRPADPGERRIEVDVAVVTRLVDRFGQAFRRPPSPVETDGLIRDYVKEQVYYREALRLGLDRDDEVVIKRLRNKMIALVTAEAEAREPTDAELQTLLDKDLARYSGEPSYDLEQIYFGADNSANRTAARGALASGSVGPGAGAVSPLPLRFAGAAQSELAEQFGDGFAAGLRRLPVGSWQGPVLSGLGLHLVRIGQRVPPPKPAVAPIRQRLTNDWRAAALRKAEDEGYRRLLEGYDVTIERPKR
jgi:peptidyl-prolyl cis-trans isomerase C